MTLSSSLQVVEQALASAQLDVADIDWLLLHQANQRILNSAADRLGVPSVGRDDDLVSSAASCAKTLIASRQMS